MKKGILIIVSLLLAWVGWHLVSSNQPDSPQTHIIHASDELAAPTIFIDPAEVFQKAFWRRPSAEDLILGAERKEWSNEEGVSRWYWNLTVKPSEALVNYLITNNAFMLVRSNSPVESCDLPEAIANYSEGFETYSDASRKFVLLWNKQENLLHATDSGTGFLPGAPEPAAAPPVARHPEGRLPTTPPPSP